MPSSGRRFEENGTPTTSGSTGSSSRWDSQRRRARGGHRHDDVVDGDAVFVLDLLDLVQRESAEGEAAVPEIGPENGVAGTVSLGRSGRTEPVSPGQPAPRMKRDNMAGAGDLRHHRDLVEPRDRPGHEPQEGLRAVEEPLDAPAQHRWRAPGR